MRSDLRGRPPDVSRILPNLLVGTYPRVADVAWLQAEHGVSAVLSLQHESDLWDKGVSLDELEREYRDRTIEFRHVPVEDYSESDLDAALPRAVAVLQDLIARGHTVFLHCNAGYNRAPTVAIAYLCIDRAMPLDDAVLAVKQRRACVPYVTLLRKRFGSPSPR
jgi:protein-tyrosine phosphatase